MIDTKALRSRILDLAIQGKLTEQLPSDGTAEELYQQIQAEKQALIKEGKIKKEKPLPEISADEIPFEIPKNWIWCRVNELFNVRSAMRIHQSDWQEQGIPFFRGRELVKLVNNGYTDFEIYISEELYENNKTKGGVPQKDDLLVSAVGTLGKVYIVKGTQPFYYKDAYILCFENIGKMYPNYIKLALDSPFIQNIINMGSTGTMVPQLTIIKAKSLCLPLPPLAEQKRIVERVEEIFRLLDTIDKAQEKYSADSQILKAKLITAGIQGKLTKQLESDGTAHELYQQIQAEKQKLIKEGKLKKEKPLPPISPEEIPFEIPQNWMWCSLADLAILENGDRSSKYPVEADYVRNGIPFFGAKDIDGDMMSFQNVRFISQQKFDELGNGKLVDGDIICLFHIIRFLVQSKTVF